MHDSCEMKLAQTDPYEMVSVTNLVQLHGVHIITHNCSANSLYFYSRIRIDSFFQVTRSEKNACFLR